MDAGDDYRTTKSTRSGGILTGSATSAFAPSTKELQRTASMQDHSATAVHHQGFETIAAGMCPKCLNRPAIILWEAGGRFHIFC
jgi:hypothetical protein